MSSDMGAEKAVEAITTVADYPLYIVTVVGAEGRLSGCVAGFVTQCSMKPPRFLVCISILNHTFTVSKQASSLALHLLGEGQDDLATLFGGETGDLVDKFAQCDWRAGPGGVPILRHCAAWTAGRIIDRFDVGDHEAVLLAPTAGDLGTETGLFTLRSAADVTPGHPSP